MSTQATPTLELLDLSEFEFEVPCEIKSVHGDKCPLPCQWTVVYRNHCTRGTADATICTLHRDYLMADGRVTCGTCKKSVPFLPYLIRIERIRP